MSTCQKKVIVDKIVDRRPVDNSPTTFPPEFFNYSHTIYTYTNHNHISGKKYKIFVPFQNGGQKTDFHFASNVLISAKIWKTTFLKEFFNEIWLKLGDHEYINIAEIKFG